MLILLAGGCVLTGLIVGWPRWFPSLESRALTLKPGAEAADVRALLGGPSYIDEQGTWVYASPFTWSLGIRFDKSDRFTEVDWTY